MTRVQADLLLLLCAAIWGLAFVFQKSAMEDVGPFTFIAARSVLAALVLAPLAWRESRAYGGTPAPRRATTLGVLGGVAFFLGAALQQWGLLTATVTNASFLTALYVVFVPFVAWLWFRIAPSRLVGIGATLSFVGIWLLGDASLGGFARGDVLVAISALFWAVHLLLTEAASGFARPLGFTCLQFVVVAVLAALFAAPTEAVTAAGLLAAAPEIAYVGILSSAFTFTVLSIALRHAPAGETAVLVSTENLFAALAGAVLLGERLPGIAWFGAALIMAAILLVQWAPYARQQSR